LDSQHQKNSQKYLTKEKTKTMSKKVYNIRGSRYGGEVTIGKVSQEFCDYWKNMEQEELESYIIDGWEDNEDASIPSMIDGEDRYWHDLDDILHFYGSHADAPLTLIDTDTEEEREVEHQFLWGREGGFFDTEEPDWDNLHKDMSKEDFVPVIACISQEKGWLTTWVLELEEGEEFDEKKLSAGILETNFGEFIEKLYYDGKELEDEGCGSSDGKGFIVNLGWFNTKWVDSLEQYAPGSEGLIEALQELTEQLKWEAENNI
jgi:hypothetical protein